MLPNYTGCIQVDLDGGSYGFGGTSHRIGSNAPGIGVSHRFRSRA